MVYTHDEWVGSGTIMSEGPSVAGEYGTWTIEYTVGVPGIDDGGHIRLAFYSSSDWSAPQFSNPAGPNYVSVRASRPVKLTPTFGRDGVRPRTKALTILVAEDSLYHNDRVTIVLGDRAAGSPGMRAQTYPERPFHLSLQIDPIRTGIYEEVTTLGIPLIGGPASRLLVNAPSDVAEDEPAWLHVCALDRWGNPDPSYRGTVQFDGNRPEGCPTEYQFTEEDAGVHRFEGVTYQGAGNVLAVSASDNALGVTALGNPIRCHSSSPARRLFWGDLHGQTHETGGAGTIQEYFTYARNVSAIDVTAHSGNDFDIPNELYDELRRNVASFYEPGRFVTFNGYEWSGNTPGGGDRNVYYLDDGPIRRSSHTLIDDKSDIETDCFPVTQLFEANAGRRDVLLTPHIGGRPAILDDHDSTLEPAIEIASQWGRFEWFAHDALQRGMRVAFIGGSDDHSGRPGHSWPTLAHHGTRGGLTAYLADELSREGIWDALQAKRCYGTSGPRIVLDVSVNGHPMGSEPELDELPSLQAHVLGTAPIERIEVRRGSETVYIHDVLPAPGAEDPYRVRIAWKGARNRGRTKALDWTGGATIWDGRIVAAENYAMDSPLDGIVGWDDGQVYWQSHTCGDWDGIVLNIVGDDRTRIDIDTPTMRLACTLGEICNGTITKDGPNLEQQLVVLALSQDDAPREIELEWTDDNPMPGWNPYWIWVTQSDGELAWSTPVYAQWKR